MFLAGPFGFTFSPISRALMVTTASLSIIMPIVSTRTIITLQMAPLLKVTLLFAIHILELAWLLSNRAKYCASYSARWRLLHQERCYTVRATLSTVPYGALLTQTSRRHSSHILLPSARASDGNIEVRGETMAIGVKWWYCSYTFQAYVMISFVLSTLIQIAVLVSFPASMRVIASGPYGFIFSSLALVYLRVCNNAPSYRIDPW